MESDPPAQKYTLRPATAADAAMIHYISSVTPITPIGLNWRHFILATDREGKIIGCGQVKTHADGSQELASIAVLPEWRGNGVARMIIEHLLEQHHGRLYLTCRSRMGSMYEKFGFQISPEPELPPYFRRLVRIVRLINKIFHRPNQLLVMRRN